MNKQTPIQRLIILADPSATGALTLVSSLVKTWKPVDPNANSMTITGATQTVMAPSMKDSGWREQTAELLELAPHSHLLVLVATPVDFWSRELMDGEAPDRVVQSWLDWVEGLATLFRSDRSRVTLIDSREAVRNVPAFADLLNRRTGLDGKELMRYIETEPGERAAPVTLSAKGSDSLEKMEDACRQLDAMTHPLGAETLSPGLAGLNASADVLGFLSARVSTLERESARLREQLSNMEEDWEEAQLNDTPAEPVTTNPWQGYESVDEDSDRLKEELKHARQRIDDLLNSKSWKLTAPLRDVLDVLGGARKETDS